MRGPEKIVLRCGILGEMIPPDGEGSTGPVK